tara:strand:- start:1396 stop:1635 length:240 start_codon:yes stop_codon:yes gene_type:complete
MVDFDINENLKNLDQETREKIKDSVNKTFGKMMPDTKSIDYLIDLFIKNIEPNFVPSCGKCRKRVINFWNQRLKSWEMC